MLKPYQRADIYFDPIQEIGSDGKNSKTYIAHDSQLDAEIVIKQLAKAKLTSAPSFFEEAKCLYAGAHPNVVQIYYACQDNDFVYIAMPYYKRGSIKGLINSKYMTVREIISAACQIVSALHNIHSKGLIHFDVKPDNVLLSDRGEALLSDFGLARPTVGGLAHPGFFYGKMIPPEVPAGAQLFNRAFDIYQLGLTLYGMCNGNGEFDRQFANFVNAGGLNTQAFGAALLAGRFPDRQIFPAHVPQRLRTVIRKCLDVDPAKRYHSALDVANDLAEIDDLLDWRLADSSGSKVWTMQNDAGTEYQFTVNAAGSTEFYQTPAAGQRRRILKGFLPAINDRELRKLLGTY